MKALLITLTTLLPILGFSQKNTGFKELGSRDSLLLVNSLQGCWRLVKIYYLPITSGNISNSKNFIINTGTSVLLTDTLKNIQYECFHIMDKGYLDWEYSLSDRDFKKKYKIIIYQRDRSTWASTEFVYLDNFIYYDVDGVVYKFIKTWQTN